MNLLYIKSSITIHEENNLDIHIIEYYIYRKVVDRIRASRQNSFILLESTRMEK